MGVFEKIATALEEATKARDTQKVSVLRLMKSSLKNQEIEMRGKEVSPQDKEQKALATLQKMIKQRTESATLYQEAGRGELAQKERGESEVIKTFLPQALSQEETKQAVLHAIGETSASSIKDMGRIMATLKAKHTGTMDFALASRLVKDALSS